MKDPKDRTIEVNLADRNGKLLHNETDALIKQNNHSVAFNNIEECKRKLYES